MEQEKAVVRNRRSLWAMASDLEAVPSVAHWYSSQAAERSILMKLAPVAQEGAHGGGGDVESGLQAASEHARPLEPVATAHPLPDLDRT